MNCIGDFSVRENLFKITLWKITAPYVCLLHNVTYRFLYIFFFLAFRQFYLHRELQGRYLHLRIKGSYSCSRYGIVSQAHLSRWISCLQRKVWIHVMTVNWWQWLEQQVRLMQENVWKSPVHTSIAQLLDEESCYCLALKSFIHVCAWWIWFFYFYFLIVWPNTNEKEKEKEKETEKFNQWVWGSKYPRWKDWGAYRRWGRLSYFPLSDMLWKTDGFADGWQRGEFR